MHAQFGRCSDPIPWANVCPISNTHIQTDMQRVCMHCLVDVQTFPAPFHGRTYATHIQTDMQRVCMHSFVDVQTSIPWATVCQISNTHIQTDMQRVCMHCLVDVQTFPAPFHGRTYVQLATHTYRLTCNECACTVLWMFRPSQLHSMGERMSN